MRVVPKTLECGSSILGLNMNVLSPRAQALEPSIIREMSARKGPATVDLTLGQPSQAPDRELIERAMARYWEGSPGYTENAGMLELREALARHHKLPSPLSVIVTVGSEQAVYLALTSMLEEEDEVLLPDPGYPAYRGIVRLLGGVPVAYDIKPELGMIPDVAQLEALCTPKTKAIIWNAPSNPFGVIPPDSITTSAITLTKKRGIAFISDEIYRDLQYGRVPKMPSEIDSDIFLVSGLSKSCALTGFRLGYLTGPESFIKKATLASQLMVTCAPRLSQLMALDIYSNPKYLRAHIPFYEQARVAVAEACKYLPKEASLRLGEGAFYATIDVRAWLHEQRNSMDLALQLLKEEDVALIPGVAFGDRGDWFLRLSYAAGAELAAKGVKRLGRFLERLDQE